MSSQQAAMTAAPGRTGRVKGNKSSKGVRDAASAQPTSQSLSLIVILPLTLFFFIGGLYVGSKLTAKPADKLQANNQSQQNNPFQPQGLPGTKNILVKWDKSEAATAAVGTKGNLRGGQGLSKRPPGPAAPKVLATKTGHSNVESLTSPPKPDKATRKLTVPANVGSKEHVKSLHATGYTYMHTSSMDADSLFISSWIYLDNPVANSAAGSSNDVGDGDMRALWSNKKPGCEHTSDQFGYSLYVNSWQTGDRKLILEYGGALSGCNKLESPMAAIQSGRWYHVAVGFNAFRSQRTELFLDGKLVVAKGHDEMEPHHEQHDQDLFVGIYGKDGAYPLNGNVSELVIVNCGGEQNSDSPHSSEELVQLIMKHSPTDILALKGLMAYFPLDDSVDEQKAHNFKPNGPAGEYVAPVGGKIVAGVLFPLVDGIGSRKVTPEMIAESDKTSKSRKDHIKQATKDLWKAYRDHAWGFDELKPLSKRGENPWGGMGMTLLDSLDTLWIMDLKDEFNEARDWVRDHLSFGNADTVSVFETTIRALGGLLAAYDLSGDKVFLSRAKELGDLLFPAFDTGSGIPRSQVSFRSHVGVSGWSGDSAILSELGSLQLEFRNLAYQTKNHIYEEKAMKPLQLMQHRAKFAGLYPIKVSITDLSFTESQITFGALGDSFYEYLLKVWLQGGRKETWLREMYDAAMDGAITKLLKPSEPSGLAFMSDWNGRSNDRKMDHLVCFLPGLLALGAYTHPDGVTSQRAQRDLGVAKALMFTCREMYHRMKSGISPEYVTFPIHTATDMDVPDHVKFYILRPETAESLFVLHQLTGDPVYREWAWEIWKSIEQWCKAGVGYGALRNVNNPAEGVDDRMESFFIAETIKYLYLVQDADTPIDLMKYVFNTEAHPTKIFDDSHKPVMAVG